MSESKPMNRREKKAANARLIAAAPEMYEALEKILNPGGMTNAEWEQAHADAHALLAKIGGE